MTYQDYIDLGFKRTEWDDPHNLLHFGYGGFFLEKKAGKRVLCTVDWRELYKPVLCLGTDDKCTRVAITPHDVQILFRKDE
jgi:hypothetical protein